MFMTIRYCKKLIFLLLCLVYFSAYGEEDNPPTYEYMQIFQSIPALFEYFLDVLEQRPQVLESDDITVFNRNIDEETGTRERRSNHAEDRNDNGVIRNEVENAKVIDKADAMATEYVNSDIAIHSLTISAVVENIKQRSMKADETVKSTGEGNQLLEINAVSGVDVRYDVYWGETFLGFVNLYSLDYQPEDVIEQIIRIEELLDNHNTKND